MYSQRVNVPVGERLPSKHTNKHGEDAIVKIHSILPIPLTRHSFPPTMLTENHNLSLGWNLGWTFFMLNILLCTHFAHSFQDFKAQSQSLGDPLTMTADLFGKEFRSGGGKRKKGPRHDKQSISNNKKKKDGQNNNIAHPNEDSIMLDSTNSDDYFGGANPTAPSAPFAPSAPTTNGKSPTAPIEPIAPSYSKPFNPNEPISAPEVLNMDSPIVGDPQPDPFSPVGSPSDIYQPMQPAPHQNTVPIDILSPPSTPTKSSTKPFAPGSPNRPSHPSKVKTTIFPSSFPSPSSPTTTLKCPEVPEGGCSLCGSGRCVSNPSGIFIDPGQQALSCSRMEAAALEGSIDKGLCKYLSTVVDEACQCATHQGSEDDSYTPSTFTKTSSPSSFSFTLAPTTLDFESLVPTEQPSEVSSTVDMVDCAAIANGTGPTEAPFVNLLLIMNLVSSRDFSTISKLLQPLLQKRVAPLVVGCSLMNRELQDNIGPPPINVVFKPTQQNNQETCESDTEPMPCFPTTTQVHMYHFHNNTSGFEPRLIRALNQVDLDALLAEIGVRLVGEVTVQDSNSFRSEVGQTSEVMTIGTIAAIVVAILMFCFVFALLSVRQRSRSNHKRQNNVEHIYLDDKHIMNNNNDIAPDDVKGHTFIVDDEGSLLSDVTSNILKDLHNLEFSNGIELDLMNQTCDVHRCASALCEVCQQKRLKPSFLPVKSRPQPPPRLPEGNNRKYGSLNSVAL